MRFGDPMAHLARRRQRDAPPPPVVPAAMQRRMRKSGFVVPQARTLPACCAASRLLLNCSSTSVYMLLGRCYVLVCVAEMGSTGCLGSSGEPWVCTLQAARFTKEWHADNCQ